MGKALGRVLTELRAAADAAVEVAKKVVFSQAGFGQDAIAVAEQAAYENNVELLTRTTADLASVAGGGTPAAAPQTPATQEPAAEKPAAGYPKKIQIGSETVNVWSKEEEKEAQDIFTFVKSEYGVEIKSDKALATLQAQAGTSVAKTAITQSSWDISELRSLKQGLSHFKQMLGKGRDPLEAFRTGGSGQSLTSVGRISSGLRDDKGYVSSDVLGEYFGGEKTAALYDSAKSSTTKLADKSKTVEGIVVHEAAHAIFGGFVNEYINGMKPPYWKDEKTKNCTEKEINTPACTPSPEMPITEYGEKSAKEDLSEAAKFFYLEPNTLKRQAPQRYELVSQFIRRLKPMKGPTP